MDIKPITHEQIEKSKQDQEILRLTVQQIIKDFSSFGLSVEFPPDLNLVYENLFHQLENHIFALLTNDPQRLYALLYRIDISDSMIRSRRDIRYDQPMAHILTDLILERELKKVLFRLYYQNHKD